MGEYVSNGYKKASFKIHMLSRIRRYITTHAATLIYTQTILPYLDYAIFVMDSAHQYSLALLDKIQKCGTRVIEYEKDCNKRKNINILMLQYGIGNLRHQLLALMYNESRKVDNLSCKTTSLALRSDNGIKFRALEKLTRKRTVPKNRIFTRWRRCCAFYTFLCRPCSIICLFPVDRPGDIFGQSQRPHLVFLFFGHNLIQVTDTRCVRDCFLCLF